MSIPIVCLAPWVIWLLLVMIVLLAIVIRSLLGIWREGSEIARLTREHFKSRKDS